MPSPPGITVTAVNSPLADALRDRYVLEKELGRGGMATVYLTRDLKHERFVALKVMHLELAGALGPERFLREIRVTAGLQHPHILTVLDSGEAAGQLWYTMPYVRGESLRDRLRREIQLSLEMALELSRQVALALDCAHRQSVVHRDLKPENILLSDGQALVADFGVAKALESSGGEQLTATGMTVGTPAYMSPEQAGGGAVDARSDIYALGCVLYEMLAGEPPFTGPTAHTIIAKRLRGPVPSVRQLRSSVPGSVDDTIRRALAVVPADRFTSAEEFARALTQPRTDAAPSSGASPDQAPRRRRLTLVVLAATILLVALAGTLLRRTGGSGPASTPGAARVAVLPFENLGKPEDEYFADGVSDAIRGKLSALPALQVIARASSAQYKKTTERPEQIGRELGVQYLLTGTVRWTKGPDGINRVQVSPELVEVTDDRMATTRWQQSFDAVLSDVFEVQASISSRVAQSLGLALPKSTREILTDRPTHSLEAYDAFLQGEAAADGLGTVQPAAVRRAVAEYRRAVDADSTFMPAWAQLARTLSHLYYFAEPSPDVGQRARQAAERASALAPERPEGWIAMGDYSAYVSKDAEGALRHYARARELGQASAELLTASAFTERILGQWDSALAHLRAARALDPRSVHSARRLTETLLLMRRYPEALAVCEQGLALAPRNLSLIQDKAAIYLAQGDLATARAWIREAKQVVPADALVAFFGAYGELYWALEEEDQQRLLRLGPEAFDTRGSWAQVLAQTYALRNDWVRARAYADTGIQGFSATGCPDSQCHALKSVQLALAGRSAEAIREGEIAMRMAPLERDGYMGPYVQHQVVRVYLLAGMREEALELLEPLLAVPYVLSPGYLRIDPGFGPLRGEPWFERLLISRAGVSSGDTWIPRLQLAAAGAGGRLITRRSRSPLQPVAAGAGPRGEIPALPDQQEGCHRCAHVRVESGHQYSRIPVDQVIAAGEHGRQQASLDLALAADWLPGAGQGIGAERGHGRALSLNEPVSLAHGPGSWGAGRLGHRAPPGGGRATVGGRVIEPGLSPSLSMPAAETEAAELHRNLVGAYDSGPTRGRGRSA